MTLGFKVRDLAEKDSSELEEAVKELQDATTRYNHEFISGIIAPSIWSGAPIRDPSVYSSLEKVLAIFTE
jgi:hypothetical protein